jgi:hypothetical protein
LEF